MVSDKKFPIVKRQCLKVAVLAAFAALPLLLGISGEGSAKRPAPIPWTGPVPKAVCGSNDRTETALQGQTTLAERLSGMSEDAYNCNLELVGQSQGEGSWWQMTSLENCAYYGTANNPLQQHRGVVVVDASDPRNPVVTDYLTSRAMLNPHESLKVHKKRKLLGATKGPGGPTHSQFAFYDISDCAHPKLLSDVDVPGWEGHAGNFAPDGRTYYGASQTAANTILAIDVTDPSNPRMIFQWSEPFGVPHDVSISHDGTRLYMAVPGFFPVRGAPNGLAILDVSDIQFRRPNPQIRVISTVFWEDGDQAQQTLPVTYRRRPHLIFTDELGSGHDPGPIEEGLGQPSRVAACARGLPPSGFARIFDISDETNPQVVAKLMLEVHDPANCPRTLNDFPPETAKLEYYGYSSHYCTVDRSNNPRMLACGYLGAGLRVFDIRDPYHPREIAYYKPPAQRTRYLPGSAIWNDYGGGDRTTDRVQTNMRFNKYKGELHIWFASQDNGFQIVRFTKSMRELLGKRKGRDDDDDDDDDDD
jgi:hypothetical protein